MLVKLIGYETKAFGRIMLPLYGAMLVFALFTGLSMRFMPEDVISGLPGVLIFMLYAILMLAIIVMTAVLSVTRFYKNLLGVEGYLMFSLPTNTATLIASKVIGCVIFSALSTVVAFVSIALSVMVAGDISPIKSFTDFVFSPDFAEYLPGAAAATLLFLVMTFLGAASSIVRIYAGIAIGHQFSDHRILMSIVALIGFNIIGTILTYVLSMVGIYSGLIDSLSQIIEAQTSRSLYLAQGGSILFLIVQIAFFGGLTWVLLDRKLNLE